MSSGTQTGPILETHFGPTFDRDILPRAHFGDAQYLAAALVVVNRIRNDIGLGEADRMMAGHIGDNRWGSPIAFTVVAGLTMVAAHYEEDDNRIVVDSIDQIREYPLIKGSVVGEFIRRFNVGAYPELNARKDI